MTRTHTETMLLEALERVVSGWCRGDCPECGGDCAGANPPVMACPVQAYYAARLAIATAKGEDRT